jgi:hypothetical protein
MNTFRRSLAFLSLFTFSLLGILVSSVSVVKAQDFDTFNNNSCKSVFVTYLPSENVNNDGFKEYKLFEVLEINNSWELTPASEQKAMFESFKHDQTIESREVLQRFKFGPGNYKKYCVDFQEAVPIGPQGELGKSVGGDSGLDLMGNYVRMIYKFGSLFIGLIGVLVIVVSGLQMTVGGIDSSGYESAKQRIFAAIFSLVMLYSSAMILRVVNPGFFT